MLTAKEASALLSILCTRLGFCLSPDAEAGLTEAPPPDEHQFTAAVFIAEGLDPSTADRKIYRQVKAIVAEAFHRSEERCNDAELLL
jgi:hypothetical protein